MSQADLSRKAKLDTMVSLRQLQALHELTERATVLGFELAQLEELETAGREPTTPASAFEGRQGYQAGFLSGWEIPLPKPSGDMRTLKNSDEVELKYQHFSVIMSASRRLPMLTAANIDGSQSRSLPRIRTWSFDGRLEKEHQWGDALYDRNPLDRGHMVRREDPVWGSMTEARKANVDTFHFTNSCPQMAGVNQQTWLGLENYILHNARADSMRVNVFTGPFFSNNDFSYTSPNMNEPALIPLAFWKVVAIVTEDGRPSATAYKVSQERELNESSELEIVYGGYKTFQISIKQVQDATGIDFGDLSDFDGYSQHELAGGKPTREPIDVLENAQV